MMFGRDCNKRQRRLYIFDDIWNRLSSVVQLNQLTILLIYSYSNSKFVIRRNLLCLQNEFDTIDEYVYNI